MNEKCPPATKPDQVGEPLTRIASHRLAVEPRWKIKARQTPTKHGRRSFQCSSTRSGFGRQAQKTPWPVLLANQRRQLSSDVHPVRRQTPLRSSRLKCQRVDLSSKVHGREAASADFGCVKELVATSTSSIRELTAPTLSFEKRA